MVVANAMIAFHLTGDCVHFVSAAISILSRVRPATLRSNAEEPQLRKLADNP